MNYANLEKLIDVIAKLRHPEDGCPWDLKQDHQSLLKYLIEECYEYIHTVEEGNFVKMEEELGDVLLQVLLHAKIASESNHFDLESVAKVLTDKMIRRHPHVFQNKDIAKTEQEVVTNWNAIKKTENQKEYHINKEDAYAPALKASEIIGAKSQAINFDWDNVADVLKKVDEELEEVKAELKTMESKERIKDEIGDLLFSVTQLARHLDIDAEDALKQANLKFIARINLVEKKVKSENLSMVDLPTKELEKYWVKVKEELKTVLN
ncbi:MAG: nucleoside triphosphate pyrophosphohydrolase [Halobacteriovoraceae bacterium]|jgi:MazG family protein|nr:nucleoside triphosphate pyrophosphohydrolase [Halobacteriovoraceae bacterium]